MGARLPDGNLFGLPGTARCGRNDGRDRGDRPLELPFEVTANKIGPILATGNTIVLKPAPDTPWNATRLGRLIAEHTDIPAGVVNVVTSSDHLVGEELTWSPGST